MGTGKVVKVNTGDGYVLDGHEAHYIRGGPEGAQIVCIFTPPCTGQEVSQFQGRRKWGCWGCYSTHDIS